MIILDKAAASAAKRDDEDADQETVDELRRSICEAWQGTYQAFVPEGDASPAEKASLKAQAAAENGIIKYTASVLPYLGKWLEEAIADERFYDLELLKLYIGLVGDICQVIGVDRAKVLGLTKSNATLAKALSVENDLERDSWDGDDHDDDGKRRLTLAEYALGNLPA